MPATRSNSSLSSRTVMSPRQFVTRNISRVSSSNTRMTKTSGAKSSAELAACGSPTRLRLWARAPGCAARGRGPAEPAPRPPRCPVAGSGRRAPPGDLAARPPPAPAAARRMARRRVPTARSSRYTRWPRVITAPALCAPSRTAGPLLWAEGPHDEQRTGLTSEERAQALPKIIGSFIEVDTEGPSRGRAPPAPPPPPPRRPGSHASHVAASKIHFTSVPLTWKTRRLLAAVR